VSKNQDQPRFERSLADAMARPDRHAIMLSYRFEGSRLAMDQGLRRERQ